MGSSLRPSLCPAAWPVSRGLRSQALDLHYAPAAWPVSRGLRSCSTVEAFNSCFAPYTLLVAFIPFYFYIYSAVFATIYLAVPTAPAVFAAAPSVAAVSSLLFSLWPAFAAPFLVFFLAAVLATVSLASQAPPLEDNYLSQ